VLIVSHYGSWAVAGILFLAPLPIERDTLPAGTITLVAGAGEASTLTDRERVLAPRRLALDRDGDLFVSEVANHRVLKVSAGGPPTVVAGIGPLNSPFGGFSGDGSPAARAALNGPEGIAVDGDGNLFIADFHNHRVRKVDPKGQITTIAGTGLQGFSGDGAPATKAMLSGPVAVAVDRVGNLFISDAHTDCVRRVARDGTITTIAGGPDPQGTAAFRVPAGLAIDPTGNLFVADQNRHRIRKVSSDGKVTTVAGTSQRGFSGDGGPAVKAQLRYPTAVAVDRGGNLFVADSGNGRVRKVTPDGGIQTIVGGGTVPPVDGTLATTVRLVPHDIAINSSGDLLITDRGTRSVLKVSHVAAPGILPGPSQDKAADPTNGSPDATPD
jgi:sugar lactone lactonase YvrE